MAPETTRTTPDDSVSRKPSLPSVYQMRCPKCRKLYSAAGETMRAAKGALKFECLACKTRYLAKMENVVSDLLVTYEESAVETVVPPAFREPKAVERAPLTVELKCPKCGTRNGLGTSECRSCGILISKAKQERPEVEGLTGEISLAGRRELAELWEAIMADYENQELHDDFVKACFDAQSLIYASQKYARILSAAPQEELARTMRKRIVALASQRFETAPRTAYRIRIPAANNLVLILGGMAMAFGLLIPGLKGLAGVGFAAILLAVGVRFFLRPQT